MDPLSVSASVVGLLSAGAQISSFLVRVFGDAQDAPKLAQSLIWEMADISAALGSLQAYVSGRVQASAERGALILLEQVLTTLTGCVTTYSDLQRIVDELNVGADMGRIDKLKWSRQTTKITVIVQRLQNHKSSLTLMLTILQCHSMQEAESSTRRLCLLVEDVLKSNIDLADRIKGMEREGSMLADTPSRIDEASTLRQSRGSRPSSFIKTDRDTLGFTFDEDLAASRVYNRAVECRYSITSVTSTSLYTTALSVFSNLSLSQVSNLSIYALPVYATDLSNSALYVFGEEGAIRDTLEGKQTTSTASGTLYEPREASKPQRSSDFLSEAKIFAAKPTRLLGRFARQRKAPIISPPTNPIHVTHMGFDPLVGEYTVSYLEIRVKSSFPAY